jgi:hypothetical protein
MCGTVARCPADGKQVLRVARINPSSGLVFDVGATRCIATLSLRMIAVGRSGML